MLVYSFASIVTFSIEPMLLVETRRMGVELVMRVYTTVDYHDKRKKVSIEGFYTVEINLAKFNL